MPVLIDGNNLLFAARAAGDPDRPPGRSQLCDVLGRWVQRSRQVVHIVFDGPEPERQRASQIAHPDIRVRYSGAGVSADVVLHNMLAADSAARRLVVVSSDREVMRAARSRRARPMRSDEFWARVQRDLARPRPQRSEPEEKEAGLKPGATDAWLSEFGLDGSP